MLVSFSVAKYPSICALSVFLTISWSFSNYSWTFFQCVMFFCQSLVNFCEELPILKQTWSVSLSFPKELTIASLSAVIASCPSCKISSLTHTVNITNRLCLISIYRVWSSSSKLIEDAWSNLNHSVTLSSFSWMLLVLAGIQRPRSPWFGF